ncbi:E2 ubiquitin-conjugating protein UBC6 Ecym_4683 [Eremothecium cymbalariae DBVPG|uniref:Ubiquitin-conjugating enzyme E2 6 n=1 Tax=Eremothecium cymbalariae (strain CBS 270.75 / DBVPG 7215 / KCTC 17166 / NRRL Y-17582) TaxID=931890 RepID=G8JSI2_ERECY|nr:hypothetical protein Ecym_4683 [Eremothecium cymbalariae DBVPG\
MASRQAYKRLSKEYKMIMENTPPYIIAVPNDENILEWHYVITGPPDTPYEGGQYHGTLHFPPEYPFKPPAIRISTPNGRFKQHTRLCLSMSDYHPDTWNPSWSVATILNGLLSFMTGDEQTGGSITTSDYTKKTLALSSKEYNAKQNTEFQRMFPDLLKQNLKDIEELKKIKDKDPKEYNNQAKFEQEQPISLDEIKDPEDRIRAQQLSVQLQKENRKSRKFDSLSSFVFFAVAVLLLVCYAH